jgi:hypothetical protein
MRIHFVSFFGVDYDMDLMPYWYYWYRDRHFDSYTVFLHRYPDEVGSFDVDTFKLHGFDVKIAPNVPYRDGRLQNTVLTNFVRTLPKEDFVVVADADEFQCQPGTIVPIDYRKALLSVDMLSGYLCDFYGEHLDACTEDPFKQYPYTEPVENNILGNFHPPQVKAGPWPLTRRTKILAARVNQGVDYSGSHAMCEGLSTSRIDSGPYRVVHFPWRASFTKKIIEKSYFKTSLCREMGANEESLKDRDVVMDSIGKGL